jgi:DNA-directed RNA polymerase specialized sigma subunit
VVLLNAKEYLRQLRRLNDIVQSKLDQIETLRSLAQKITYVPKIVSVQESIPEDKMTELISKIVDLQKELETDINNLLDLKLEIMHQINSIDNDDYKLLLMLRYLNFKTWEEIAVEMGCSYQWVHVLHSKALIYFQEKVQFSETLDRN